jgi:hypothetical protein
MADAAKKAEATQPEIDPTIPRLVHFKKSKRSAKPGDDGKQTVDGLEHELKGYYLRLRPVTDAADFQTALGEFFTLAAHVNAGKQVVMPTPRGQKITTPGDPAEGKSPVMQGIYPVSLTDVVDAINIAIKAAADNKNQSGLNAFKPAGAKAAKAASSVADAEDLPD